MAEKLIMTIKADLCGNTYTPKSSLLNKKKFFFKLCYDHSYFLTPSFGFNSLFIPFILHASATFFTTRLF